MTEGLKTDYKKLYYLLSAETSTTCFRRSIRTRRKLCEKL